MIPGKQDTDFTVDELARMDRTEWPAFCDIFYDIFSLSG